MNLQVSFNARVQNDIDEILDYYENKSGTELADEFFGEFDAKINVAMNNPKHFPIYAELYRKAQLDRFPYHFVYRHTSAGIRVIVLRHNRRHPRTGMSRR